MAGFIPAPPPGPQLTVAGAAAPLILGKQPVTIVPGAGMTARQHVRDVVLDAVLAEPPEAFALHRPGTIAAGVELGTWRNTNRGRAIYLRKMLANFETAQTVAGDALNHYRLKVTDGKNTTAVVPLNAVSRSFVLDQGIGSVIEGNNRDATGTTFNGAVGGHFGFADKFTVAQKVTLTGLVGLTGFVLVRNSANDPSYTGVFLRGSILDDAGRVLAAGYAQMNADRTSAGAKRCPFSASVQLVPGKTYYRAFDVFENPPERDGSSASDPIRCWVYQASGASSTSGLNVFSFVAGGGMRLGATSVQPTGADLRAASWEGLLAGDTPPAGTEWIATGGDSALTSLGWHALGSPSGLALLYGDLTFAIDAVGVPPAGSAGSGLNLHAVLAVS